MWSWIARNAAAITAVSTSLGLLSLVLIFKQLRDSRLWNKLHFTYTFFPNPLEFEAMETFLDERISFWKRDLELSDLEVKALIGNKPLTAEEKKKLSESFGPSADKSKVDQEMYEAGRKLKLYLNQIESYCAAISSGIIDSESARHVYSYKFHRAYEKALPWIKKIRSLKNEQEIYIETEKILDKWYPAPEGQKSKYGLFTSRLGR